MHLLDHIEAEWRCMKVCIVEVYESINKII